MSGKQQPSRDVAERILDALRETGELSAETLDAVASNLRKAMALEARANDPAITRRASILMTDIRGFTLLAEQLSSAEVLQVLNRYFELMSEIAVRHGGVIDKLLGDGMMVVFTSDTKPEGDDARRAVVASVEMQRAMEGFNEENERRGLPSVYMGIGINTGPVVMGPMGSRYHREYTAIGEHVNLAARVEAHSLRGQILISEYTRDLAGGMVDVGEPRKVYIKGRRDPVLLYELLATHTPKFLEVPRRELRRSVRIQTNISCEFFRIDGQLIDPVPILGQVVDISAQGVAIETHANVPVFTSIKLPLALSLLDSKMTPVYARMISCEELASGFRYGAEFTAMDEEAREVIQRFVDDSVAKG